MKKNSFYRIFCPQGPLLNEFLEVSLYYFRDKSPAYDVRYSASLKSMLLIVIIFPLLLTNCDTEQCRVENLGLLLKHKDADVIGLDGCAVIKIRDDLLMWTFGDTIIGHYKKPLTPDSTFENTASMKYMLSNSLAFTESPSDHTITTLRFSFMRKNNNIVEIIERDIKNKATRFWPVDGIRLGNDIYLYYIPVHINDRDNKSPFRVLGTGIARWSVPSPFTSSCYVHFKPVTMLFNEREGVFGDSVILHNHMLYLTGRKKEGAKVSVCFARVRESKIIIRNEYEFLCDNGTWSKNIMKCHTFFGDVSGEATLSFNPYIKRFLIIYCSLDGTIKLAQFKDFSELQHSNPISIYTPKSLPRIKTRPSIFYYSGKEIAYTEKNIYIIYINPVQYQPILLKIPYCKIR